MTMAIALAVLIALAIGILACVLKAQAMKLQAAETRAEQADRDRAGYQQAFGAAESRAVRLKQTLEKNVNARKEANNERQELAATPDTELVNRANRLFGSVPDKSQN